MGEHKNRPCGKGRSVQTRQRQPDVSLAELCRGHRTEVDPTKERPMSSQVMSSTTTILMALLLTLHSPAAEPAVTPAKLPYDRTCPVIYDNDYANDYVDWYLMALASVG